MFLKAFTCTVKLFHVTLSLFSFCLLCHTKFCWFRLFLAQYEPFGNHRVQLSCFAEERNKTLSELIVTHIRSELITERGLQASSPGIPSHLAASIHPFMVLARHRTGLCLVKELNILPRLTSASSFYIRNRAGSQRFASWSVRIQEYSFPREMVFVFYRFSVSLAKPTGPGILHANSDN